MTRNMKQEQKKIDVLKDSPIRVLFSICMPLIFVSILSIFTTSITNDIYSKYVGQIFFAVTGLISLATTAFAGIIEGIVSAGWIKVAMFYTEESKLETNKYTMNAIYAILIVELACMILLLGGADFILHMLNIPDEVFRTAKQYYVIYIATYAAVPIGSFLLMVVDGIGKSVDIFLVNCINSCGTMVAAAVVLIVFRGGLAGAAALPVCNAVILIVVCLILMKKNGMRVKIRMAECRPDFVLIRRIVSYGLLIALQSLTCNVGYLFVTIQTNRYLSLEYISVLNVSLPLSGIMSALSTACMVFVPQNYNTGNHRRVKKFFAITLVLSVVYGTIAFAIHALLGEWYYGRLFDDRQIIAYGKEYWFWNGLGYIFVAVIYVVRYFFDAVGQSRIALISGIGELLGNLICAFWLIPKYGNIGRSISYTLGWLLAAVFLLTAYVIYRKKSMREYE